MMKYKMSFYKEEIRNLKKQLIEAQIENAHKKKQNGKIDEMDTLFKSVRKQVFTK